MVPMALKAANSLAEKGIATEIADLRTLVPLDEETIINSVKKNRRVLIVYEANQRGSSGAEVAAILADKAFKYLKAPIRRVAAEDVPIPFQSGFRKICPFQMKKRL